MKVLLAAANSYRSINPPLWLKSKSTSNEIICTDNPEEAEVIIFVENHAVDPYYRRTINHPLFKKYRHKCVLYHDADLTVTTLPTLAPSIEKWQHNPKHKRTFHYIVRVAENQVINEMAVVYDNERTYLYSFIGAKTHSIEAK